MANLQVNSIAQNLTSALKSDFLIAGALLAQVHEMGPEIFSELLIATNIKRRRAYYLISLHKTFSKLGAPDKELQEIGWTKCCIISKYASPKTIDMLLYYGKNLTAHELRSFLRGKGLTGDMKVLQIYLGKTQYKIVSRALVKFGAKKSKFGLGNKDVALVNLATFALTKGTVW